MKMDRVVDYRGDEHRPEFGSPDTGHSDILLFHRQPGLVECRNRYGHSDGYPLYGLKKQQKARRAKGVREWEGLSYLFKKNRYYQDVHASNRISNTLFVSKSNYWFSKG